MTQKIDELRAQYEVQRAKLNARVTALNLEHNEQLEAGRLDLQKATDTFFAELMDLMGKIKVEEVTEAELRAMFVVGDGSVRRFRDHYFNEEQYGQYSQQYDKLMEKIQTRKHLEELAAPWEKCDSSLFYEKLKMELDKEDSIVKAIGDPYVTLISELERLQKRINELHDIIEEDYGLAYHGTGVGRAYSERERSVKIFYQVVEDTVNLLFKKTISVEDYKAKCKELAVHASPALRAIGVAMMSLAVAIVALGLLFPIIPVGVVIGTAIGASLAGCGFFYVARRPNNFPKETQDKLSKSMSDTAAAVSEINFKPL